MALNPSANYWKKYITNNMACDILFNEWLKTFDNMEMN